MNELIELLKFQVEALQIRNAYLEKEILQAKGILQDIINDWEVFNAEEVSGTDTTILDTMFDNPMEQLDNLF